MQLSFVTSAVAMAILAASVRAETHTIRFDNKCGSGTPQLIQGGTVLSSGEDFVANGPFSAAIAYLQTGNCGFNGDNCLLLETTLQNPTAPGAGSSTDLSLIAPHAFSVTTSFSYFNGCDGQGATCDSASCPTAFFQPNDNQVQVQCETNDVNLLITFCGSSTALTNSTSSVDSSVFAHASSSSSARSVASSTAASHTSAVANVAGTPSSAKSSATTEASASASSATSCKRGSARRRSFDESVKRASFQAHRRHHARNAEAARRGPAV